MRYNSWIIPIAIICGLFFITGPSHAYILPTETYTDEDGLPGSNFLSMLQDSKGFIWLGTKEGLNRYDGYSVVAYRNDPYEPSSLSSNTVTTIFEDRDGALRRR